MNQQIKEIDINDLVLWTENPRDPIDKNATDQEVVDHAIDDNMSKWNLSKLAKEMRGYYDFSELPTVVYHGDKPIVYDGNRRMILAKIKHGLVNVKDADKLEGFIRSQLREDQDFVQECNKCFDSAILLFKDLQSHLSR